MEITKIAPHKPAYEIAERYCSRMDANVILMRVNEDASTPPVYRCLSSHLCSDPDNTPCRHRDEKSSPQMSV